MAMPLQTALTLARNIELDGRLWVVSIASVWGPFYQVTAQTPPEYPGKAQVITWAEAPKLNTTRDVADAIDEWLA